MQALPVEPVLLNPIPHVPRSPPPQLDPAVLKARLETLGFVNLEQTFETKDAARDFVRGNLFLQSKGKSHGVLYSRYICNDKTCPFTLREYVNDADQTLLQISATHPWHKSGCERKEKRHGLPPAIHAASLKDGPRKVIEDAAKKVKAENVANGTPENAPIVVCATQEQVRSVRRYAAKKNLADYKASPAGFLQSRFPGSKVHVGVHDDANVVCGSTPHARGG